MRFLCAVFVVLMFVGCGSDAGQTSVSGPGQAFDSQFNPWIESIPAMQGMVTITPGDVEPINQQFRSSSISVKNNTEKAIKTLYAIAQAKVPSRSVAHHEGAYLVTFEAGLEPGEEAEGYWRLGRAFNNKDIPDDMKVKAVVVSITFHDDTYEGVRHVGILEEAVLKSSKEVMALFDRM